MIRILWGIIIAGAGIVITLYGDTIFETFGAPEWAERYLGGGRFFYKLLGIVVTGIGFLVITNLHQSFVLTILGFFFPQVR